MTSPPRRERHVLDIDGAHIVVDDRGDHALPVLLFLHGGLRDGTDVDGIAPALERAYRIVAIDSRGQGQSTMGPAPLTYARMAADALHVLDALHIDQCDIVGHSDGGITGYRLAAYAPSRVRRLVTIGSRWHRRIAERREAALRATTVEQWQREFATHFAHYSAANPAADPERLVQSS